LQARAARNALNSAAFYALAVGMVGMTMLVRR
jgi:hypothetical protein